MDEAELLRASQRERALYAELGAVYQSLAEALGDERAPVDTARVAAEERRAEAAIGALRALAAALAPHRLTGAPVAAEVQELWRASAAFAAAAAAANAAVTALAHTRRAGLGARLARLADGRRGLAAYRPAGEGAEMAERRV